MNIIDEQVRRVVGLSKLLRQRRRKLARLVSTFGHGDGRVAMFRWTTGTYRAQYVEEVDALARTKTTQSTPDDSEASG